MIQQLLIYWKLLFFSSCSPISSSGICNVLFVGCYLKGRENSNCPVLPGRISSDSYQGSPSTAEKFFWLCMDLNRIISCILFGGLFLFLLFFIYIITQQAGQQQRKNAGPSYNHLPPLPSVQEKISSCCKSSFRLSFCGAGCFAIAQKLTRLTVPLERALWSHPVGSLPARAFHVSSRGHKCPELPHT